MNTAGYNLPIAEATLRSKTKQMRTVLSLILVAVASCAWAAEVYPPRMLRDIECLKNHGLIEGTVTQVRQGEAHFAPYFRETAIGARVPSILYNSDFVEGQLKVSPDIITICVPGAVLRKNED